MLNIKEIKHREIIDILKKHDKSIHIGEFDQSAPLGEFESAIKEYINPDRYNKCSILGIDIYRYSKYSETKQFMIPIIFNKLYSETVEACIKHEQYIFQNMSVQEVESAFISTGDGGFQLFPTPIHAFIFAIYFEANLRTFNSFTHLPKLRNYLGEINLRYTLTHDNVFHFNNNYFGPAIINNSRILNKDHLNRFLIDSNTYNWFLNKTGGIESLLRYDVTGISNITDFKNYDKSYISKTNLIFPNDSNGTNRIRLLNIQKVGLLDVKGDTIDIHSVYTQVNISFGVPTSEERKAFVLSLGNTNSSGI